LPKYFSFFNENNQPASEL